MGLPTRATSVLGIQDVRAAASRLEGVANRTPVLTSRALDRRTGGRVYLKAECFQRTGSFKFRGAYNAIAGLDPARRRRGVAAFSSGNHAQAVALAARLLDTTAVVVMPADAPAGKVAATRGYGAEVVVYDRYSQDRQALGEALAAERGLTLIPPYDHPDIMAGQGTTASELLDEVGDVDLLLVPVGGGGLAAGCATAAKAIVPGVEVLGVEPQAGDDTARSLRAGRRVRIEVPRTIADGQQIAEPGRLTFQVNRRLLDGVVLVSDDEIVSAMRVAFERLRVVVEPSGASALAALLSGRVDVRDARVGVVVSGGNVDAQRFCALVAGSRGDPVPPGQ